MYVAYYSAWLSSKVGNLTQIRIHEMLMYSRYFFYVQYLRLHSTVVCRQLGVSPIKTQRTIAHSLYHPVVNNCKDAEWQRDTDRPMDHGAAELEEALIMMDSSSGDDDVDLAIDPSPRQRQRRSTRRILQAIFLLLGVGILVPWNAFISAKQYFQSRLCVHDADTNTYVSSVSNIESVFAMLYNFASVLSLGLVITIQAMRDQVAAAEHSAPSSSTDVGNDDDGWQPNAWRHERSE